MITQLSEYKDKHLGQDIYVLGSGASLNFIAPDFFDNKITIGINQIYKYTRVNYIVKKDSTNIIDDFNLVNNDTTFFLSKHPFGTHSITLNINNLPSNLKIILFDHNDNKHELPNSLPEEGCLVVSHSTITTGIHLAAYMGAKNIIIVGHDCGFIDGKPNVDNYHSSKTLTISWKNQFEYNQWLSTIENDTIKLKNILREKYNCNIHSLNPFINFGLEGHVFTRG